MTHTCEPYINLLSAYLGLKQAYNFSQDTELYVINIDHPDIYIAIWKVSTEVQNVSTNLKFW